MAFDSKAIKNSPHFREGSRKATPASPPQVLLWVPDHLLREAPILVIEETHAAFAKVKDRKKAAEAGPFHEKRLKYVKAFHVILPSQLRLYVALGLDVNPHYEISRRQLAALRLAAKDFFVVEKDGSRTPRPIEVYIYGDPKLHADTVNVDPRKNYVARPDGGTPVVQVWYPNMPEWIGIAPYFRELNFGTNLRDVQTNADPVGEDAGSRGNQYLSYGFSKTNYTQAGVLRNDPATGVFLPALNKGTQEHAPEMLALSNLCKVCYLLFAVLFSCSQFTNFKNLRLNNNGHSFMF